MHLMIITPIFPPTTGGAATYYGLLAHGLLASGEVTQITVITERSPQHQSTGLARDGRLRIVALFPHRAGRYLGHIGRYWRYGIQNLQYFVLPRLVKHFKPDIILVHSSLHIHFNTLRPLVHYLSKRLPVVADVRDHQLDASRLNQLDSYAAVIACSRNVLAHVSKSPVIAAKAIHIPVLQERISRERPSAVRTLTMYGLRDKTYLLFAGLIKKAKGVDLLLDTFSELCSRGFDAQLVIAGLSKNEDLRTRAMNTLKVRMIGALPREEILDLMSKAIMNINISTSEGMPRTSLEALAFGTKVLLPSGIPEFNQYCPESVVRSNNPKDVADQIQALLANHEHEEIYPIEMHDIHKITARYIELFQSQIFEFKKRQSISPI